MALTNYDQLEELDAAGIRRLLDPNYDRSEVNRIAAERSLGGGGFSGARLNRLQESELMQRQMAGNAMLSPYLARQHAAQSQTQSELAALTRQNEADKQAFERLRFSSNANDQQQAREISERIRSQNAQLAAASESQRLSEQGAISRQALQEQGMNTRQATGIEAELKLARERAGIIGPQSAWNQRSGVGITQNPSISSGNPLPRGGGQQSQNGPNSATMAAIQQITSGFGGGPNMAPNLASGNQLGTLARGNSYGDRGTAPGWGGNQLAQQSNLNPTWGNYQSEGGGGNVVSTPDYYGNVNSEPQSAWQSGSNVDEIDWSGVTSQINNPKNWSYNSYDGLVV